MFVASYLERCFGLLRPYVECSEQACHVSVCARVAVSGALHESQNLRSVCADYRTWRAYDGDA